MGIRKFESIEENWNFSSQSWWKRNNSQSKLEKSKIILYPTGVKRTFDGKKYLCFRAEKRTAHQWRNLGKALFWTISTLGLGILSSSVRYQWRKGIYGVTVISYSINKQVIIKNQNLKDLSKKARNQYIRELVDVFLKDKSSMHELCLVDPSAVASTLAIKPLLRRFVDFELFKNDEKFFVKLLKKTKDK
jgi:hypothetical protein